MKVGFISLGCSKNLIDTEVVIGKFKNHNYEIVQEPEKAEIIVINTCGFIESAKEEAINTILEMAEYKAGMCKYLIVMGCLVQRYYKDLQKAIPEVDLWIKLEDYDDFWEGSDMLYELARDDENELLFDSLCDKMYATITQFKDNGFACNINGFIEPLKYVKIQVKGNKRNEG